MNYEQTYLGVKVTATGNTARELSRWSDAARQEYLRDQVVMFLNGRKPDLFVSCVDEQAVALERCVTEGDRYASSEAIERDWQEARVAPKPTPAPATQGGEWPKWTKGNNGILRYDSDQSGVEYGMRGIGPLPFRGVALSLGFAACVGRREETEITPTQAAEWLRANGHAKVADEIDGEGRFEPVGTVPVVGDRVCYPWSTIAAARRIDVVRALATTFAVCSNDGAPAGSADIADFSAPDGDCDAARILKRGGSRG